MFTKLAYIALFVRDMDEALSFYTDKLGFAKVADKELAPGIRWVTVAPNKSNETMIRFDEATNQRERERIGKQLTNMLVTVETGNFEETYQTMKEKGVEFVEEPTSAP
jgi:catechol 2,3-dioxygenase-like lactoylglutathione lyase family enzyme